MELNKSMKSAENDIGEYSDRSINFTLDWIWLAEKAAGGVVGSIAGDIIKSAFGLGPDYSDVFHEAIEEICKRVGKIVKEQFVTEYIADCETARRNLIAYLDSNDIQKLRDVENQSSYIVGRLKSTNDSYETMGFFMLAANIHLSALKLLVQLNEPNIDYKTTLVKNCELYADWAEDSANRFFERVKTSVSECIGGCSRPEPSHRDLTGCNYSFTFDYGNDSRSFFGLNVHETKTKCEETREIYYNDRVNSAQERKDRIISICNTWRSINIPDSPLH